MPETLSINDRQQWTDEFKAIVRKRLFELIAWRVPMCKLSLSEARKQYPDAEITEEKGVLIDGRPTVCRRYITPWGGRGWIMLYA